MSTCVRVLVSNLTTEGQLAGCGILCSPGGHSSQRGLLQSLDLRTRGLERICQLPRMPVKPRHKWNHLEGQRGFVQSLLLLWSEEKLLTTGRGRRGPSATTLWGEGQHLNPSAKSKSKCSPPSQVPPRSF